MMTMKPTFYHPSPPRYINDEERLTGKLAVHNEHRVTEGVSGDGEEDSGSEYDLSPLSSDHEDGNEMDVGLPLRFNEDIRNPEMDDRTFAASMESVNSDHSPSIQSDIDGTSKPQRRPQGASTLATYVQRFRHAPPLSRETRDRLRAARLETVPDFWWQKQNTSGEAEEIINQTGTKVVNEQIEQPPDPSEPGIPPHPSPFKPSSPASFSLTDDSIESDSPTPGGAHQDKNTTEAVPPASLAEMQRRVDNLIAQSEEAIATVSRAKNDNTSQVQSQEGAHSYGLQSPQGFEIQPTSIHADASTPKHTFSTDSIPSLPRHEHPLTDHEDILTQWRRRRLLAQVPVDTSRSTIELGSLRESISKNEVPVCGPPIDPQHKADTHMHLGDRLNMWVKQSSLFHNNQSNINNESRTSHGFLVRPPLTSDAASQADIGFSYTSESDSHASLHAPLTSDAASQVDMLWTSESEIECSKRRRELPVTSIASQTPSSVDTKIDSNSLNSASHIISGHKHDKDHVEMNAETKIIPDERTNIDVRNIGGRKPLICQANFTPAPQTSSHPSDVSFVKDDQEQSWIPTISVAGPSTIPSSISQDSVLIALSQRATALRTELSRIEEELRTRWRNK